MPQQRQVPQHRREPNRGLRIVDVWVEHAGAHALVLEQTPSAWIRGEELPRHPERPHGFSGFGAERGAREPLGERRDASLVDVGVSPEEALEGADAQGAAVGGR